MPRNYPGVDFFVHFFTHGSGRHGFSPVDKVEVLDPHRDRRPKRNSVPYPRAEVGAVFLDLHATAGTVTLLTPGHLFFDVLLGQFESGRYALDDHGEAGAVRLSRRQVAKCCHSSCFSSLTCFSRPFRTVLIGDHDGGRPVQRVKPGFDYRQLPGTGRQGRKGT